MQKVYIMRGPSGSGKNYWIEHNIDLKHAHILSADDYHITPDGKYVYVKENAKEAHDKCLRKFTDLVRSGTFDDIVVANTNIRAFEFSTYYRLAEAYSYDVEIVWIVTSPEQCKARTVHGTPPEIIDAMFRCLEPIPAGWNYRVVLSNYPLPHILS